MEGSRASAGRLIIKQAPRRQPRETEANHSSQCTPTAVLVQKTIPGPIAGSLRGPWLPFCPCPPVSSTAGEQSCCSDTRPTCPLQPLACSRKRVRSIAVVAALLSSLSQPLPPPPPLRPGDISLPLHHHPLPYPNARTWSAVAHSHTGERTRLRL